MKRRDLKESKKVCYQYGLVSLLILLAWLLQSLLGIFSLSSINFLCTFSLERKSTKKFKHAWGYNTCVHSPWFNCCITVTSTAVPWFLKMLRLLLVFMKRRDLKESKKVCYQYGLVLLLILLAWLLQLLLGIFSLNKINLFLMYFFPDKKAPKIEDEMNCSVHIWFFTGLRESPSSISAHFVRLSWLSCCTTVTSTAVPWFLKTLRLLLVSLREGI